MAAPRINCFCENSCTGFWLEFEEASQSFSIDRQGNIQTSADRFTRSNISHLWLDDSAQNEITLYLFTISDGTLAPRRLVGSAPYAKKIQAASWVERVNAYLGLDLLTAQLQSPSWHRRYWNCPVIRDAIDNHRITYSPGYYVYGRNFFPIWNEYLLDQCRTLLMDEIRDDLELRTAVPVLSKVPIEFSATSSYLYLIRALSFRESSKIKLSISLELLFDVGPRRDFVEFLRLGCVNKFDILTWDYSENGIKWPGAAIPDVISFGDLLNHVQTNRSYVGTYGETAVDYVLRDQADEELGKYLCPEMTSTRLASWFCDGPTPNKIIAADTGIIKAVAARLRESGKRNFSQVTVEYPERIDVGLSYRRDDAQWGKIVSNAWGTINEQAKTDGNLKLSFEHYMRDCRELNIEIDYSI